MRCFTSLLFFFLFITSAILLSGSVPGGFTGFRENKGQICDQHYKPRPDVLFSGTNGQYVFHLRKKGISYQLNRVDAWAKPNSDHELKMIPQQQKNLVPEQMTIYRIDVNWLQSNTDVFIKKEQDLEGYDNFYSESCPGGALFVKSYEQIVYQQLYKGIDLKWYNKEGHLKYDYIVAAGADYHQIRLEINGAKKISVRKNGALVIKTPLGELIEQAPLVLQNGRQLPAAWVLDHNQVSFRIDGIDPHYPVVIDPLIRFWGTYYGGSNPDELSYSCVDPNGDVFVSGDSRSTNLQSIATTGSYQSIYGGAGMGSLPGDAVLVKFNASGQRLWSTYYGGAGADFANQCDADAAGNVYMVGTSNSTNAIASPGSHQPVYGGGSTLTFGDAFVVKFNTAGARIWGTYYGGTGDEWSIGCCTDPLGNVYMAAISTSTQGIASPGCHQPVSGGLQDGFLVKLDPGGARLWSTYYGGTGLDGAYGCNTDAAGNVYLTGHTLSNDPGAIATPGSYQPVWGGATTPGDGFLAKFNPAGVRQWATYYGGGGDDYLYNCQIDASGNIYTSGVTSSSSGISTGGSHQPIYGGGSGDAFLVKFDASGMPLWASYYGGTGAEDAGFTAFDANGYVYISGTTASAGGTAIATPCTYQDTYGGNVDMFIAKFDAAGTRMWGTYYGGTGVENWGTISVALNGNFYLAGLTGSSAGNIIASVGSHQPVYGGGLTDGFFAKFDGCIPTPPPSTTPASNLSVCPNENTVLTTSMSCNISWFDAPANGNLLGTGMLYATLPLSVTTSFYVEEFSCGIPSTRTAIQVTVVPLPVVSASANPTVICSGQSATLTAAGAVSYTWQPGFTNAPLLVNAPPATSTYTVMGNDGNCTGAATVSVMVVPTPSPVISALSQVACLGKSIDLTATGANTYAWQPAALFSVPTGSAATAQPTANTLFTVTGTNSFGALNCSGQGTFPLVVLPYSAAFVSAPVTLCEGSSAVLSAQGGSVYEWKPTGAFINNDNNSIIANPSVSTIYSVTVSGEGSCGTTQTVMVTVNPRPKLFAGRDTSFNLKEPMFISAVGTGSISWISGDDISCPACPSTQVFPIRKSCYVAQAINGFGCTASDEVCIDVGIEYAVYIPNTFTPNQDGLNDEFTVTGFGISELQMHIYDRWGQLLFSSSDAPKGWNGFYKGELCQPGVYLYAVEYTSANGKRQHKTGHVTLLR